MRDLEEFREAVESHMATKDRSIEFSLSWLGTRDSWFLSARTKVHGKRVVTYIYAETEELDEVIDWVDRVAEGIHVPGAFQIVILDTKPAGRELIESDHYVITADGFRPVSRAA